jgi:hypothetical protein
MSGCDVAQLISTSADAMTADRAASLCIVSPYVVRRATLAARSDSTLMLLSISVPVIRRQGRNGMAAAPNRRASATGPETSAPDQSVKEVFRLFEAEHLCVAQHTPDQESGRQAGVRNEPNLRHPES